MPVPGTTIRQLTVRPINAVDLSFEVDGILASLGAKPGQAINAPFDFPAFYSGLGSQASLPGLLQFDSSGIDSAVQSSLLASLRAEGIRGSLDSAVATRQNAYLKKYISSSDITNNAASLSQQVSGFQASIIQQIQNQANLLATAYAADQKTGVVKTTSNVLKSVTKGHDYTTSQNSDNEGVSAWTSSTTTSGNTETLTNTPTEYEHSSGQGQGSSWERQRVFQHQTTTNTGYGYRVPAAEAQAGSERSQISLLMEQYSQFLKAIALPNLQTILANELKSIDLGVRQLQIAYCNTLLLAPQKGVVSKVYRHVGEFVRAGEPVLRIEDLSSYYLVGTVVSSIPVSVGMTLNIKAPLSGFFPPANVSGSVLFVEGGREENEYEVTVAMNGTGPPNQVTGSPLIPPGYRFESYDTQVSLT